MSEEGAWCPRVSTAREMDETMAMSSEFIGRAGQASDLPGRLPGELREVAATAGEGIRR